MQFFDIQSLQLDSWWRLLIYSRIDVAIAPPYALCSVFRTQCNLLSAMSRRSTWDTRYVHIVLLLPSHVLVCATYLAQQLRLFYGMYGQKVIIHSSRLQKCASP